MATSVAAPPAQPRSPNAANAGDAPPPRRSAFAVLNRIPGAGLVKSVVGSVFSTVGRILYPPLDGAPLKFIEDLERKYPFHPPIIHGSYAEAVQRARETNRMLFVYLHSPTHQDTAKFEEETLFTEAMQNFLGEHFLCWIGNIRHPEAFRVHNLLQADAFPFMAVLFWQRQENREQLSVGVRHCGFIDSDELIAKLYTFLDAHEAAIAQVYEHRTATTEARSLREQQDIEYQMAIAEDRERRRREEEQKAAIEAQRREVERQRAEEAEAKARAEAEEQERQHQRQMKLESLGPEPAAGAGTVAVALRLPDGSRTSRRFLESQPMRMVFDFIESHDLSVDGVPIGNYQVMTNYPKRVFEDPNVTLREAGLGRQCVLFVQEIVDETAAHGSDADETMGD